MAKVEIKAPIVAEISECIKDAQSMVVVDYRGLTVEQDTELRKSLREAGVAYKVYKNTFITRAIKGTEFEGMSIQMMAAMVMLEVGATKKKEAEFKIAEMKAQNDRAKQLNNLLDRMNAQLGAVTKDGDDDKKKRGEILGQFYIEARALGVDTSNWEFSKYELNNGVEKYTFKGKTAEQIRAITSQIQHMAENCNSDNQTQMVKLQDFMGQYNSFVSGASDSIKQANQILQGLAKS